MGKQVRPARRGFRGPLPFTLADQGCWQNRVGFKPVDDLQVQGDAVGKFRGRSLGIWGIEAKDHDHRLAVVMQVTRVLGNAHGR